MDEFVQLPRGERRVYFEQTAARLGLRGQLIEKDFWVCWILRRLFSLDEFLDHLTFKGGTSLSKVYGVIQRFSEDVDVSIERHFLGFGGDLEPEQGKTGKERRRRITRLKEACQAAIAERLTPQLHAAIAAYVTDEADWSLTADSEDKDGQALLFKYPAAITTDLSPYFSASVKIELGARSDHFPVETATVTPYLSDAIPGALTDNVVRVRVLGAERTFWEKATILHQLHHLPVEKKVQARNSRHYYDVVQMSNSTIMAKAMDRIDLLDRVAMHKRVFFKAAWANYETARAGTLRLVPQDRVVAELKRDYAAMQPMFFGEPPSFEMMLKQLQDLERRINHTTAH